MVTERYFVSTEAWPVGVGDEALPVLTGMTRTVCSCSLSTVRVWSERSTMSVAMSSSMVVPLTSLSQAWL